MEGRFGNIVLTANRVDPFIRFGLSQNTNDLLRAVLFLFHEPTPYQLRNSLDLTGANQGSHANTHSGPCAPGRSPINFAEVPSPASA